MIILVKVTKEIIKASCMCCLNGESNAPTNCAISLAVREIFPDSETHGDYIELENVEDTIALPKRAQNFIEKFDEIGCIIDVEATIKKRLAMTPISFKIKVPSKIIDQIGISEVYKILSESRTLELVQI